MVADIKSTVRKYLINFESIVQRFKTIPSRPESPRKYWGKDKVRISGYDFYKVSDEIISDMNEIFRDKTMSDLYHKAEWSSREYHTMQNLLEKAASGSGTLQYDYFSYTDQHYFLKELVRRCDNIELKKMIIHDYPDVLSSFRPMPISEELLQHILDYKLLPYMTSEPYKKTLLKNANDNQRAEILYFFMGGHRL